MKIFFSTFFFLVTSNIFVHAQATMISGPGAFWNDVNGMPLKLATSYSIEGTPFWDNNYQLSDIILLNNKKYEGIKIKLDLSKNELLALNSKNEEIIIGTPVKEIILKEFVRDGKIIQVILRGIGGKDDALNHKEAKIVEVLQDGPAFKLYKSYTLSYHEGKAYSDASMIKKYSKNISLLALNADAPDKTIRLSKTKSSLLSFFNKKSAEIKKYIDQNKTNFKSEDDLILLFQYANTLN